LATRWLGQAVATGGTTSDDALNLIELARLYLREGNLRSAQKTLNYIEVTNTTIPAGLVDEVWGDIHLKNKRFEQAAESYDKALVGVAKSARHRNRDARIRFQRGLAIRALGKHAESIVDLQKGLDGGGAPRGPQPWIRLIESTLAIASKPADYEQALVFCAKAEQGELNETSHRAVSWHRSHALAELGRTEEADQILQDLSGGTDAWAVMAVEAQLDNRFNKEIDRLLSLPTPTQLRAEAIGAPPSEADSGAAAMPRDAQAGAVQSGVSPAAN
jgi:tetratricopeptide (TPR) repeat protein